MCKKNQIFEITRENTEKYIDFYIDVSFSIATDILWYMNKHDINEKEFAKLIEVTAKKIELFTSGTYNFTLKEICKIYDVLQTKMIVTAKNVIISFN